MQKVNPCVQKNEILVRVVSSEISGNFLRKFSGNFRKNSQGRPSYGGNDARCVIEISGGRKEKNPMKFCKIQCNGQSATIKELIALGCCDNPNTQREGGISVRWLRTTKIFLTYF